ncbi:rRNA pseudouridine synthase [Schaedlerella arabinosiphila]|uniref:Pseudouridine synthase n=1 Tax=Schaedlerella arabinosiphila TaxID=2044587 RepID=A0A9X5CBW6_9FIRM|nr:pseudouridine synthase [Schaedlerella arabinosiphila]KAI4443954.1 Ribosomal small subunit pseudouridine synthase A [Schaedlerella arabinosiphila]NDO71428.1 rRNA pseudouridine synthase [Schaedlerella arabinosiphila]
MKLRLDKYLADMGLGTRSEVKQAVRKGRVQVNGQTVREPEYKTDTETDQVWFDGQPAAYREYEYYMLNKPAGVISASEDPRERCVVDLIESRKRKDLFPVGRLDKDTEGLLLITNDGGLAHRLLSPKKHVDKVYYARVQGRVTQEDAELFRRGVDIGEKKKTLPAELRILNAGEISEIELTIREGKFHQVKRMFHAAGKEVLYLKRLQMGSLRLDESLKPGEYRTLNTQELDILC